METQPARQAVGSEKVLCRDRSVYGAGDVAELPRFQSDESARLLRCGPGLLHAAFAFNDHADDEQRRIMGDRVNTRGLNILGWITTAAIFAATIGVVITWFI